MSYIGEYHKNKYLIKILSLDGLWDKLYGQDVDMS